MPSGFSVAGIGGDPALAAAVLTQFGVDTHNPNHGDREVRRVVECRDTGSNATLLSESKRDC